MSDESTPREVQPADRVQDFPASPDRPEKEEYNIRLTGSRVEVMRYEAKAFFMCPGRGFPRADVLIVPIEVPCDPALTDEMLRKQAYLTAMTVFEKFCAERWGPGSMEYVREEDYKEPLAPPESHGLYALFKWVPLVGSNTIVSEMPAIDPNLLQALSDLSKEQPKTADTLISGDEVTREITAEWLDTFNKDVAEGKNLADSIFWRLALDTLPEGVDRNEPQVIAALAKIRESICINEKG